MSASKADYLKRYLSAPGEDVTKKKKKKKKRKAVAVKPMGIKIIDDDITLDQLQPHKAVDESSKTMDILDMTTAQQPRTVVPTIKIDYNDGSGWVEDNDSAPKESEQKREQQSSEQGAKRQASDSDSSDVEVERPRRTRVDPGSDSDSSDASPPRRRPDARATVDSPKREAHAGRKRVDPGSSSDSDVSLPRRRRRSRSVSSSSSSDSDASPPRRQRKRERLSSEDDDSDAEHKNAASSGSQKNGENVMVEKKGLQTGKEFSAIARKKKKEHDRNLAKMLDASGPMETVIRDQYGRKLSAKEREKAKKEKEAAGKVEDHTTMEWGGGLVQKQQKKAERKALKKSKKEKFSRSRDDSRMNDELKEKERWGDPMLMLMRQRKAKKERRMREELQQRILKGEKKGKRHRLPRPMFEGDPFPNRYSIRPGYRWDGRDRSNGWEQKRFKYLNQKKARDQAAYKWGASDL